MINIAKILKNYPKGTTLYSPIFGEVKLEVISPEGFIMCYVNTDFFTFFPDGRYSENGEVMLFPSKDQRDWNEFRIPFKEGDVVYCDDSHWTGIIQKDDRDIFNILTHVAINSLGHIVHSKINRWHFNKLATEEEKQRLFKIIKNSLHND